ncbi:MAG: hypothetical protein Q9174_003447 [Haloplaca sp. 1 TL-2023]
MAHNVRQTLLAAAGTCLMGMVKRVNKESWTHDCVAYEDFAVAAPSGLPMMPFNMAMNTSSPMAQLSNISTNVSGAWPVFVTMLGFLAGIAPLIFQILLLEPGFVPWGTYMWYMWSLLRRILPAATPCNTKSRAKGMNRSVLISMLNRVSAHNRKGPTAAMRRASRRQQLKMQRRLAGLSRENQAKGLRIIQGQDRAQAQATRHNQEILRVKAEGQDEIEKLRRENTGLIASNGNLTASNSNRLTRIQTLVSSNKKLSRDNRILTKAIRKGPAADRDRERLEAALRNMTQRKNDLERRVDRLNHDAENLNNAPAAEISRARVDRAENKQLHQELEASKSSVVELKASKESTEGQLTRALQKNSLMLNELDQRKNDSTSNAQNLKRLSLQFAKKDAELAKERSNIETVRAQRDDLDGQNEANLGKIEKIEEEVETLKQGLGTTQRDLDIARDELETFRRLREFAQTTINGHEGMLKDRKDEIDKLENQLAEAKAGAAENQVNSYAVEKAEERYEELHEKYQTCHSKLVSLEVSHQAINLQLQEVKASDGQKEIDIAYLKKQMSDMIKSEVVEELKKEVHDRDQQIRSITEAQADERSQNDSATEALHHSLKYMEAAYLQIADQMATDIYAVMIETRQPWAEMSPLERVNTLLDVITRYCEVVVNSNGRSLGKQTDGRSLRQTADEVLAAASRSGTTQQPGTNNTNVAGNGNGNNGDEDKVTGSSTASSNQADSSSPQDVDMMDLVGTTQPIRTMTPLTSRPSAVKMDSNDDHNAMDTSEPAQDPNRPSSNRQSSGFSCPSNASFSTTNNNFFLSNLRVGNNAPSITKHSCLPPVSPNQASMFTFGSSQVSATAHVTSGMSGSSGPSTTQHQIPFVFTPPASVPKSSSKCTTPMAGNSSSLERKGPTASMTGHSSSLGQQGPFNTTPPVSAPNTASGMSPSKTRSGAQQQGLFIPTSSAVTPEPFSSVSKPAAGSSSRPGEQEPLTSTQSAIKSKPTSLSTAPMASPPSSSGQQGLLNSEPPVSVPAQPSWSANPAAASSLSSQQEGAVTSIPRASTPEQAGLPSAPSNASLSTPVVRRPKDKRRTNGLTFGEPSRHARKAAHRPSPLKQNLNDDDDLYFYVDDPDPDKKAAPKVDPFNRLGSLFDPNNPPYSPFSPKKPSSKPSSQSKFSVPWKGPGNPYDSPSSSPAFVHMTGCGPLLRPINQGPSSPLSAGSSCNELGNPYQSPSSPASTSATGHTPLPGLKSQAPAYKSTWTKPDTPPYGSSPSKVHGPHLPVWLQQSMAGKGSPTSTGSSAYTGSPTSTGKTPSKPPASIPWIGKPKDDSSEESEEE